MAEPGPLSSNAPLRLPDFRWLLLGTLTTTLSLEIQGTVIVSQIADASHHSAFALGLAGLAEVLPNLAMALLGGHVADTLSRRVVAFASILSLSGCALALLLLSHYEHLSPLVWSIYGVLMVSGATRSFLMPARTAWGAELVPREQYQIAVKWRSAAWQLGAVAGPGLGGVLYAWIGAVPTYAIALALMLLSLVATALIRHRPRPDPRQESMIQSLQGGIRFVRSQGVLLAAMTLDLFAVLFGGAVALLPIFADQILKVGPEGLGVFRAAPALGALVMSISLAYSRPFRHAGRTMLLSVALFGICMIVFGISLSFPLSVAVLLISGAADYVSVVVRQSLIQITTPRHLLGRVAAVNAIFVGSSNELGAFESGMTASWFGTIPSVVLGGALTLAVVGATATLSPGLRRLGEIRGAQEPPTLPGADPQPVPGAMTP